MSRKFIPSYNVFVDNHRGMQLLALSFDSAYDASAVVNRLIDDTNYMASSDLWQEYISDAMMRPEVVEMMRRDFASLGVLL